MTKFYQAIALIFSLFLMLLISGCGDEDSGPQPATITQDNAEPLALSGANALSLRAVAIQAGKAVFTAMPANPTNTTNAISILAVSTVPGSCGGSFGVDANATGGGVVSFTDYCEDFGEGNITLNGKVVVTLNALRKTATLNLTDFTVTQGDITQILDTTLVIDLTTKSVTVTSQRFRDRNGNNFITTNLVVTGNGNVGYSINGDIDSDFGEVTLTTADPIFFSGCARGIPSGGKILVTSDTQNSASITFQGCTAHSFDYQLCTTINNVENCVDYTFPPAAGPVP